MAVEKTTPGGAETTAANFDKSPALQDFWTTSLRKSAKIVYLLSYSSMSEVCHSLKKWSVRRISRVTEEYKIITRNFWMSQSLKTDRRRMANSMPCASTTFTRLNMSTSVNEVAGRKPPKKHQWRLGGTTIEREKKRENSESLHSTKTK